MSHITDMLLLTNEEPNSKPILALNAWCGKRAAGQMFKLISEKQTEKAGGGKVFTTKIYACAGNFFPWDDLIDALPKFGWTSYAAETTALVLQDEDVERWIAVHADGRRLGRDGPRGPSSEKEKPT